MKPKPDESVVISKARIARVMDVLSLTAIGEFSHEKCHIDTGEEDDFGLLEQTLNILTQELGTAQSQNARYVEELTKSRQELSERLATIEAQQTAIERLSTPVLEIWDGVLALPVVGSVDHERALLISDTFLSAIVHHGAHSVIVDVTGAAAFDTATADYFLRLAKSATLLGALCVFSGIGPDNATALVALGVDFSELHTCASLKDALRICLKQEERTLVAGRRKFHKSKE